MSCLLCNEDRAKFAMERDLVGSLKRCGKKREVRPGSGHQYLVICTLPVGHKGECGACYASRMAGKKEACFARTIKELPPELYLCYSSYSGCS
jgi:hypothetical protein